MQKPETKLIREVRDWFLNSVTFEGEPYVMDLAQIKAVIATKKNTIVAARAGSGKTRTIVAKIVYLVAKRNVKPDEIMAFVFNANAAKEINARLSKMKVDGRTIIENAAVASTFHAFSRRVVYELCDGREKCREILAEKKDDFINLIVRQLMMEEKWQKEIKRFLTGEADGTTEALWRDQTFMNSELELLSRAMSQFVNRAEQKFLGSRMTLGETCREYLASSNIEERERLFLEIGTECYERYHRELLGKNHFGEFSKYGTDFNLIVSWAAKLIKARRGTTLDYLKDKKYLLIDEYQDFSQLFLFAVFAIRSVAKEARLFVVGDDLQAINRFAGSEVEYFKNFEEFFDEDSERLELATNYRSGYEIVNTVHHFMKKAMHEKGDFRAYSKKAGEVVLVDLKLIEVGRMTVNYDQRVSEADKKYQRIARKILNHSAKLVTLKYLKVLVKIIKKNRSAKDILILHRNNEMDGEKISLETLKTGLMEGLEVFGVMEKAEFLEKVKIMTMHKSKGLEAEVVIILEADEGVIPKSHPDTSLYRIFGETEEIAFDDQKRLFYVAMTRAKRKLYIIYNGATRGGFIKYLGRGLERWNF